MAKTVLVTNAVGSLACGILRIIRSLNLRDVRVIGISSVPASAANHLCDQVVLLPASYTEQDGPDIPFLKKLCREHDVGLIIPTTDFETYHLKLAQNELPWVACSPANASLAFYDKLMTAELFTRINLPFAKTCLPRAYRGQFARPIVKPRRGGLSKDVFRDATDPSRFSDEFVVQETLVGPEITCAFYATKDQSLHGLIAFERELHSGSTVRCETTNAFDDQILAMAQTLMKEQDVFGSCNIQGIAVDGRLVPFEVNGRVSGTASIRAQFGFEDVRYLLQEYLLGEPLSACQPKRGAAVRMVTDVIYPDVGLDEVASGKPPYTYF
jgi:carbamoyl-phosphate synthase large subunit